MKIVKILELIGRTKELFQEDIQTYEKELSKIVSNSTFLVIGGAGSIGQAVTKEIFKRNPKKLHVVDISENNMVELVRDIRSSFGYINGDFKTFALDIGSMEYDAFIKSDLQHLVNDIMESDLKLVTKDQYLKDGGYTIMNYFE